MFIVLTDAESGIKRRFNVNSIGVYSPLDGGTTRIDISADFFIIVKESSDEIDQRLKVMDVIVNYQ